MKNIEIAKKYLNAAYTGDIPAAGSLLSEDVKLSMDGHNEMAGIYEGRDAFFGAFKKMLDLTGNTYKMESVVEWLEGNDRAVLIALESATRNGEKYEFHRVIDYVIKNDQIVEIKIYEGEPTMADKAFIS